MTTLIAGGILLLLSLTTPLFSAVRRRPSLPYAEEDEPSTDATALPRITIVLTPQGDARQLDEHLPLFLTQDYPAGYDIIVVSSLNDSGVDDVLKRYRSHENLHTTFIPTTTRYMSHRKLAITLGVKASANEWILLCDPACKPISQQWLQSLARECKSRHSMVLGYVRYKAEAPSYYHFERFYTTMYLFRESMKHIPYRTNCPLILFRKTMFMEGNGYQGDLKYTIGEYDFLVNKYANEDNTGIALTYDSWMEEDIPTEKGWQNIHIFYQEIRLHLLRSFRHRILYNVDHFLLHLFPLLVLSTAVYAAFSKDYVLLGASIVSPILNIVLRYRLYRTAFREYGVAVRPMQGVWYEWSMLWRNMRTRIRYEYADKFDFISHKV